MNPKIEAALQGAAKQVAKDSGNVIDPSQDKPTGAINQTPPVTPPAPVTPAVVPPVEAPAVVDDDQSIPDFLKKSVTPPAAPVVPPVDDQTPGNKELNFANLRKQKEKIEAEKLEIQKKLESVYDSEGKLKPEFLKSLNVTSPDTETLKKERDLALDQLAKYDLQADPRWQAKYSSAENVAKQSVLRIAKEYGVDPKEVTNAMMLPLKERIKFFNEQLPDALPIIAPHLAKIDEIMSSKQADLENAKQVRSQMEQQNATVREHAIIEARQTIHAQAVRKLETEGFLPFKIIPGNDEWNKGVENVKKYAMELLSSSDINLTGEAIVKSAAADVLQKVILPKLMAENRELRKQVQLHAGAGASITTGNGTAPVIPAVDTSNMSIEQLVQLQISNLRK